MSNGINSLGCAIAQETGLTETAAAAAACVPVPAVAAWLGRRAFAGPPGVTSGASSSPAALGSGALGSPMTGTAWHAVAAGPTCACIHTLYMFEHYPRMFCMLTQHCAIQTADQALQMCALMAWCCWQARLNLAC